MKACPHDNVTFRFRRPLKDLLSELKLTFPQTGFILIVFGFAFYEVVTEWGTSKSWLLAPFKSINALLGIPSPWDGTFTALLLFFIIPVILFTIISFLHSTIYYKNSILLSFKTYVVAFIPLIAFTHFAKAILKSVSRFQYIPGALNDPEGIKTAKALQAGMLTIGGQWQYNFNTLAQVGSVMVMVIGFIVSIYLLKRLARDKHDSFPVFYAFLLVTYFACTTGAIIGKFFSP